MTVLVDASALIASYDRRSADPQALDRRHFTVVRPLSAARAFTLLPA
jgi:hypothetical protein